MKCDQCDASPNVIIAVDPGRDKCGIAVVHEDGQVIHQAVVSTAEVADAVARLLERYAQATLVLGDRTGARNIGVVLSKRARVSAVMVDEHRSTIQGRRRYFRENPPRGWRRLIPLGLQTPPRPFDDYVAVVIAERYIDSLRHR